MIQLRQEASGSDNKPPGGVNMDVYEAIFARRTVRDFQDREIDLESIERILDAGLHAPTNNHLREWEFVIVNDKSVWLSVLQL